ncbi:MAG TPA: type II secretion system F family protein [Patescibacteria group bacterium]|nr:type II secretion system F family protein [Patescibacteria group bacterium]
MSNNRLFLSTNEKIGLISNLTTMLAAGIPIMEATESLLSDSKGNSKIILAQLRDDLIQGNRVNASFAKFPRVFDKVTINLIKASEEAGTLAQILKDLKDNYRREAEFSDKIKGAMIYPILILIIFTGVLLMILIVVVPKISTVFSRLPIQLPLPTKILIAASNILLKQTIPLFAAIGAIVFLLVILYKRNRGALLGPILKLPLISDLVKKIDIARFAHSMHLLLSSGLPITAALELAQDVVVRPDMRKLIGKVRETVASGKHFSEGFRDTHNLIPVIMVKLLEVGDKTGTLDKSMEDISDYMEYEVGNQLKTITVVLEPIMLVFVGIAVGGMMLAIIAPIYGLIGQVGGR